MNKNTKSIFIAQKTKRYFFFFFYIRGQADNKKYLQKLIQNKNFMTK